jgi:hypothetical protein
MIFIGLTRDKGRTATAVKKCIPHRCADLPPLLSVEATGVCILIGNTEILLAAVYKSLQRVWSDTDITELLGFRNKSILAGDLNAKHPVWNSRISNPSGQKLLELFADSNFEISTPQCSMHYRPDGRGDVINTVVHHNVRLSEVMSLTSWTRITYQSYLAFWTVRMRETLDPV